MKYLNNKLFLIFSFLVIFGCASVGPPNEGENIAITEGKKSLVLLRVTCELPGGSAVEPFKESIPDDNVNIALGDFETGGALKRFEIQRFLSPETRKQGWIYFLLEPGIYYLGLQGQRRTNAFTYQAQWERVEKYWFDIQPDTPVVYIGTMHLHCRSDWFITGAKYCSFIDNQNVKNEELLVQKLVSENLIKLSPPKTALMQLQTTKTLIFRTPKPKK